MHRSRAIKANYNEANSRRILIVDDNQDFAASLQEILASKGYTVATAYDAKMAQTVANRFDPQVALLDVRLGQDDGVDLIARLKRPRPDIICVMVTAYRSGEAAIRALRQGAYDYLTKPLHPEELLATLERCFEVLRLEQEREQAEKKLQRANWSLQALSACNEALVRATDEMEFLHKVCRIIVDVAGYRLAWVGFTEHDKEKSVKPIAQAGFEDGYLDTIHISWAETERGSGPTGTAIRTGRLSVVNNILTDPSFKPWREAARKRGFESSVALPLIISNQPFGALNIYSSIPDAFDDEETHLLQELADDLAYGIKSLRTQEESRRLEHQLQQAQKMETIGQLTGGIAHDFNNILASIIGFTGLALERHVREGQDELRECLMEVYSAGARARDLISQILAFSRHDSVDSRQLALQPLIKEVAKMLQATLPSSIELQTLLDEDTPSVMMDPVRLHQVVMNLCINARDAIGSKGRIAIRVRRSHDIQLAAVATDRPTICASCSNIIPDDVYVELSVQDSGCGIGGDWLKRIFEPFFTTKDVGKGTGMGLPMVHGIVHQHGGHILVTTEPGVGTTFKLLLPEVRGVPKSSIRDESSVSEVPAKVGDANILIIDDEESIARFMGTLFERLGYYVVVKNDSRAALELFARDPHGFDLVITDQTMPGLTGMELAQELMALRPDIPVILCTGYNEHVDEARAKAVGIRAYLTKPMEPKILLNTALKVMQESERLPLASAAN